MHKSTIFFAAVSLVLAAALGGAVLWLARAGPQQHGVPGGAGHIRLGLPEASGDSEAGDEAQAGSALVWDPAAGVILFAANGFERRPIASITKLMTAMVALDFGIDWNAEVTIEPDEYVIGGRLLLHDGEHVTNRDLFHAALLGSANNATLALVRSLGVSEREFTQAMNRKAIALGLEQTEFYDVTGLSAKNVSTAYEVARMAETAWRDYPAIAEATARTEYTYQVGGSGREHTIKNTNKLITDEGMALLGGKTGYLDEARYCLVAQSADSATPRIAVVLGSATEEESVQSVKTLLQLDYGGI